MECGEIAERNAAKLPNAIDEIKLGDERLIPEGVASLVKFRRLVDSRKAKPCVYGACGSSWALRLWIEAG